MAEPAVARAWRRLTGGWRQEAALVGLGAVLVLAIGIAALPPFGRDEGRFAQAAREMLDRGDWIVPTFAGRDRYDKPILIYWLTMASYAAFGVKAGAARLPSLLAAAATAALVAGAARRRWGPGAGLLAGALLVASPVFHLEGKACTADMVMLLPTTAAMLALGRLWRGEGGPVAAAVLWAGIGFAVLAKGPVAPAVIAGTALAGWAAWRSWRRWQVAVVGLLAAVGWAGAGPTVLFPLAVWAAVEAGRDTGVRARLARLRVPWGSAVAAALVLPWAALAWWRTDGAFVAAAVGRQVVERSLTAFESHGGFPGFYLATAPVAAFPWLAAVLAALVGFARRGAGEDERFALAWLIGTVAVFELTATRLVHYALPAYPAGVLLAVAWARRAGSRPRWWATAVLAGGGLLLAAAPAAALLRLGLEPGLGSAVLAGGAVAAGVATGAPVLRRSPARGLALAAGGGMVGLVLLTASVLPRIAPATISSRTAAALLDNRDEDETVAVLHPRDDEIFFLLPLDAEAVRSDDELAGRLVAGEPVLAAARAERLESFRDAHPEVGVEVVARVRGIDLGRGEWAESAVFRSPGAGVGDDR